MIYDINRYRLSINRGEDINGACKRLLRHFIRFSFSCECLRFVQEFNFSHTLCNRDYFRGYQEQFVINKYVSETFSSFQKI